MKKWIVLFTVLDLIIMLVSLIFSFILFSKGDLKGIISLVLFIIVLIDITVIRKKVIKRF